MHIGVAPALARERPRSLRQGKGEQFRDAFERLEGLHCVLELEL